MKPTLTRALNRIVPQRSLGRLIYRLARSRRSWIKRPLIRGFHALYRVDLADAEISDPTAYDNLNAYFTRALKPGARPLEGGDDVIVSPVDGRLTEFGQLDGKRLIQAKGIDYTLEALLADTRARAEASPSTSAQIEPALIEPFVDGHFATIYLAPHDYHRVHAPIGGTLAKSRYIAGRRYPVNEATAKAIAQLFCSNERVVLWLDTAVGPCAVVMVGALNVASLTTTAHGEIASGPSRWLPDAPMRFSRGAELGRFNLGSTVVLLLPRGAVEWDARLATEKTLVMGQGIGYLVARGPTE